MKGHDRNKETKKKKKGTEKPRVLVTGASPETAEKGSERRAKA